MALRTEHELHARRRSRNLGLLVVLIGFAALVFALSVVKVSTGGGAALEGYDHQVRPSLLPRDEGVEIAPSDDPVAAPGTPAADAGARAEP
ncbi:hypothetical protein SAMN05421538_101179 [Paracoccus isoporae]|uniref:Cytochrome C oxidase assembly protein n=1 Tax=Paracoccus isoporae TaxID=591205 RepID=A0A1G6T3M2_9RHOB|nr:hypothetical protein [Paracoccus isoporae]SDD23648.1 hypothetical protein SAMN05421538_101179 [Paracoccus isoporae]